MVTGEGNMHRIAFEWGKEQILPGGLLTVCRVHCFSGRVSSSEVEVRTVCIICKKKTKKKRYFTKPMNIAR